MIQNVFIFLNLFRYCAMKQIIVWGAFINLAISKDNLSVIEVTGFCLWYPAKLIFWKLKRVLLFIACLLHIQWSVVLEFICFRRVFGTVKTV